MKVNGWLVPIYMDLIGSSIVAFVRSLLGNFRETQNYKRFKHTGHNFRKLVIIQATTHPCQHAVQRSTPSIGISFERCSMLAWWHIWRCCQLLSLLAFHIWIAFHDNVGYYNYTFVVKASYVRTHTLSCDLRAFIFNIDLPWIPLKNLTLRSGAVFDNASYMALVPQADIWQALDKLLFGDLFDLSKKDLLFGDLCRAGTLQRDI